MNIEGRLFITEGRLLLDPLATNYVTNVVLNDIDAGSEFDIKNKEVMNADLSPADKISYLAEKRYDVMIGYQQGNIIGHTAFQTHYYDGAPHWEMFRIFIPRDLRHKGYVVPLAEEFLREAWSYSIHRVKLGNPERENEKMRKLLKVLKRKEIALGISVDQATHLVSRSALPKLEKVS